jgi:hypothetical protein
MSPTTPNPPAKIPSIGDMANLLRAVSREYTRDDALPDRLLPRIYAALEAYDARPTDAGAAGKSA